VKQKKSSYFTLMIMPETSGGEVRRLRVPRRLVQGVVGAVLALTFLTGGAMYQAAELWGQADANAGLVAENRALKRSLESLDDRLQQMDRTVDRLDQLDKKLRALTMVSDPARNLAIGPVGAPDVGEGGPADESAAELRRDLFAGRADTVMALVERRAALTQLEAEEQLKDVESLSVHLEGQRTVLASTPSRRPAQGYVTSTFGMRVDPFVGLPQLHAGIDYSANIGAPVFATADATVVHAGLKGSYGKTVELDHGQGLVTKYAHLSRIDVQLGEKITRGQMLGAVGNTGRSTGPHLHYEVRLNGIALDPQRFLLE
jgi:murein DD-endopeptidase MepM/ murein hydrolase activator NlpD